ncbi:MAG TPA: hypothetical protein VFR14_12010 [Candidatus Limnocylindrales bacterium]|nr:hypothetical protein [Candidatus Limnocylindrales bacterium]
MSRRLPMLVAALALAAVAVALLGRPGGALEVEEGVIVSVDAAGLADVRGFTLRTADARTLTFRIDALENAVDFPPSHLIEHQATAQAVLVSYRLDGEALVAVRIEDAP